MNNRQQQILNHLQKYHTAKNEQLAKLLQVSMETIRRDVLFLENLNMVTRVHGGAYLNRAFVYETDYLYRTTIRKTEKQKIALKAVEFVKEKQVVGLDVSTTNTMIALELAKNFKQLTIITNSIVIAVELAQKSSFTVIMPGGLIRNEELCFIGESSAEFIEQFHIDLFFMSFSGVSLSEGFSDYGFGETQLKKAIIKQASKIHAVGDSSKFEVNALLKVCPLNKVDSIITDNGLPPQILQKFEECGTLVFQ